jgi:hypothetical protein
MTNLTDAIQLIRQGRKDDARLLLESVLKLDSKNIQAWFWYVETIPTPEKRIQILDVCLKVNPGNQQVVQALQTLRGQQAAQAPVAPFSTSRPTPSSLDEWRTSVSPFQQTNPQPLRSAPAFGYEDDQSSSNGMDADYYASPSAAPSPVFDDGNGQPARDESDVVDYRYPSMTASKPAFDWDALEKETAQKRADSMAAHSFVPLEPAQPARQKSQPGRQKSESSKRSYAFYEVWFAALVPFDVGSLAAVLDDPEGGTGRAFEWMAITGVITGLISPFLIINNPQFATLRAMPEFSSLLGGTELTTIMIILMVAMTIFFPIFNILGLALIGALLNFLATRFGGTGNFSRTVYAQSAYLAPLSLISTLVTAIPGGQCVGSLLGFYFAVLNVRSIMAAQNLTIWGAIKTLLAPGVVMLFIFGCILILVLRFSSAGN